MSDDNAGWRAKMQADFEARKRALGAPELPRRVSKPRPAPQQFNYGPPLAVGTIITFRVIGEPMGQPRPKAQLVRSKNKRAEPFIHIYTPDTAKEWKNAVRAGARPYVPCQPIDGPVRFALDTYLPRPKYLSTPWYEQHAAAELRATCKPDFDNLAKLCADVLTELAFWNDDAQVSSCPVEKFYHAIGQPPGVRITIEVLAPNPTPPKRARRTEPTADLFGGLLS